MFVCAMCGDDVAGESDTVSLFSSESLFLVMMTPWLSWDPTTMR